MHTGARASIVTWRVWGAGHVLMCSESGIHQVHRHLWWTDWRHLARLVVGWIGMTSVYLEQSDGRSQVGISVLALTRTHTDTHGLSIPYRSISRHAATGFIMYGALGCQLWAAEVGLGPL